MNFEDLQVDPVDGAETMRLLGLNDNDLVDPVSFQKIYDIIMYFKGSPQKSYVIHRVVDGKGTRPGVDKVDYLWNYVTLKKQYQAGGEMFEKAKSEYEKISQQRKMLEKEIAFFES